MENEKNVFKNAYSYLKKDEFYLKRDYKTVGGMWTVETWQKDNLRLQIMDEGYTRVIMEVIDNKVIWSAVENSKGDVKFENINNKEFEEKIKDICISNLEVDSNVNTKNKPKIK